MMKVIALIGLVIIEKIQLTIDLATHITWKTDHDVTIIDNGARMAIDPIHLSDEPLMRVSGDITDSLADVLKSVSTEIVLVAVSETAELDNLFVALDIIAETMPDIDLTSIGLIDLRTCDCFPHLREKLEDYADAHFLAPFELSEVLHVLRID